MITKDNLKSLLITLNFTQDEQIFSKVINDTCLQVNFAQERLIYPPSITIHEQQTCNFKAPENFVVFECVHRLLEKGYQPEHIELEPRWQVGHGASGGRADIMLRDYANTPFLIIECKTYGREFNQAWKDTLEYGGQIFSYVEQEKSVAFVCLYAADLQENTVQLQQKIIALKDNDDLVANNPDAISFEKATNVKQRFSVWKTIYKSEAAEVGIFEPNIAAYTVGKNKYTLEHDTLALIAENMRGKYHEFRTILRTFNVSRRENAFEVLVNLFLCKIVDEQHNQNDLNFYWKGIAYDDYFKLVDRLQRLYQLGMREYLKQDITYVSEEQIKNAFWAVKKGKNTTQNEILKLFHDLKYYKGLDFDFIKVTNKENFDKNAKILIKIIEMWQNLRLTSHEQNQFLGDMFEYFLDNGVKQSEGQFFTPIPICKFIVSSLPLEQMVDDYDKPLNVIDYACGSGHFLTEYADHISDIVKRIKHTQDITPYYQAIIGIEKEDRLAKVAKVAAFMHGRNDIKVLDNDALAVNEAVKDNHFDVLIANPPFAVEEFLTTLDEVERERFSLIEVVNNLSTNTIQCFFLERTAQLMQAGGVVGVIVPSSILSNTDNIHIRTREILLSYFDFISITELGSQTFGKTGTNTVVLFLRRKTERPEQIALFAERVESYFNSFNEANELSSDVFDDSGIIRAYCDYQVIDYQIYIDLLKNTINDELFDHDLFKNYQDNFNKSSDITKLLNQKTFKSKTKAEQTSELNKKLLDTIRVAEQDKLLYFILTRYNQRNVLVIKAPSENKAQKAFLGYEWSSAKGNEGLQYQSGDTVNSIITPMFDPKDRLNPTKLSYLIQQNFIGESLTVPDELAEFVSQVSLTDMLDFSRTTMDKAIRTSVRKKVTVESKYPVIKLIEFPTDIKKGKSITEKEAIAGTYKVIAGGKTFAYKHNEYNREENTITISASGANAGFVNLWREKIFASDCTTIRANSDIETLYIFNYLQSIQQDIFDLARGSAQPHVYPDDIKSLKIPLPPLDVQAQIVAECEKIDNEYETSRMKIEEYRAKIANVFNELEVVKSSGGGVVNHSKINELCILNPSKSEVITFSDNLLISFVEMASVSNKGYIETKVDKPLGEVRKGSYTYFAEKDIILAKITPCMENGKCAIAMGLTNNIGMGSSEFHVIRVNSDKVLTKFLFGFLNRPVIRIEAEKNMTGSSGHRRVPISFYEKLVIPLPPVLEQREIISEIEEYEKQIRILEQDTLDIHTKKQAILNSYLT